MALRAFRPYLLPLLQGKTMLEFGYLTKVISTIFSPYSSDIVAGGGLSNPQIKLPSDLLSFSHVHNATRLDSTRLEGLRKISSSPDGIWATVDEQLGSWHKYDRVQPRSDHRRKHLDKKVYTQRLQKVGIGLPMSNIYAT